MIEPLDESGQRLLAELLAGERSESDPEVAALLLRRPDLRSELAALRGLMVDLEAGGAEGRRELDAAIRTTTAGDVDTVQRALRSRPDARRRRPWVLWVAAAAVLVAIVAAWWPRTKDGPSGGGGSRDQNLNATSRDIGISTRRMDGSLVFEWTSNDGLPIVPPGGSLKIVVKRIQDGKRTEDELFEEPELDGTEWQPRPEQVEILRAAKHFWWELRSVDAGGTPKTLQSADAMWIGHAALRPEVLEFGRHLAALGRATTEAEHDAACAAILAWLQSHEVAASLCAAEDQLPMAVADGRRAVVGSLLARRAAYEYLAGYFLTMIGARATARDVLHRCFFASPPAGSSRNTVHEFVRGTALLAQLQHAAGDFDAAVDSAQRAQNLAQPLSRNRHAESLSIEARVRIDLGELDRAWPLLRRAQQLFEEVQKKDDDCLAMFCTVLAEFYLAQDRCKPALDAVARYGNRELPPDLAVLRCVARLGQAERDGRSDLAAESELRSILELPEAGLLGLGEARTMLVRAALQRAQRASERGDPGNEHFTAARAEFDRLPVPSAGDEQHPLAWRGHAARVTLATRLLLVDPDTPYSALQAQLPLQREAFTALLRGWRQLNVRPGGIGFLAQMHRRQVVSYLIRLTDRVEGRAAAKQQAADALLAIGHATSLARKLAATTVSLKDVRATFTPARGAGVLVFLGETDGSIVLAFDCDRLELFDLAGSFTIEPRLRELQAALSAAPAAADEAQAGDRLLAHSQKLADLLLQKDLRAFIAGWDTVTVADHGLLSGMPWECLAWDGATLFGERFAVNSLTSLSLGLELQQEHYRPAAQHLRARLVATLLGKKELRGSDAGGGDLADDDAERLLRPYARHADEALLNERATRRRAMVVPPGLDVLHFLAHGGRDDAADAAGLALTPAADDDGLLGATDAETMQVPGVVILSACGLGRSHARLGDDPLVGTLGGAFLAAGAHTVVQSSADLRLRSQLALWEQVHAELAHGAATATALRTVRARLAGSSSLVTRFEYAQVQVFGLGHLPLLR